MPTSEERLKVLKMIQEGKITAEEGAQLLELMDEGAPTPQGKAAPRQDTAQPTPTAKGSGARWFRVRITDTDTGKTRVNVRLPIGLVNAGLKMGAKFSPEVEGLDVDQLMQFINSGEVGQIVDVVDHEDGEHVEVLIE